MHYCVPGIDPRFLALAVGLTIWFITYTRGGFGKLVDNVWTALAWMMSVLIVMAAVIFFDKFGCR